MEKSAVKKRGPAAIFHLCPWAHVLVLLSGSFLALFFALRKNRALMQCFSALVVQPLHHVLARLTAALPFSLAEWLYAAVIAGALVYIICEIILLILRPARLRRLYRLLMRLAALVLSVYALFCLLWGVYYYGDDFIARSGLEMRAISTEELADVTRWFAGLVNDYAPRVARDENGLCRTEREAVLARSPRLFRAAAKKYGFLSGPEVPAKGMAFSRLMSLMEYTGFFCPFTGEANVNTDFPEALFAATVAHELSQQRGVAQEDEANFVAVLASLESEDADFCYSACLLAYIHLGNALHSADPDAFRAVYQSLSEDAKADLAASNRYWEHFDTPINSVADTVYEGFLQSYGQTLGLRSYGACVDLLVNYYLDAARAPVSFPSSDTILQSR